MARWKRALAAGLVLATAAAGLAGCTPSGTTVSGMLTSQQEGIWVTGRGEVSATPDIATVTLGVEAQEETVSLAQVGASDAMDRVMSVLAGRGVADRDIQTQYFNIRRVTRWDREKEQEVVIGYRVTNVVAARIRDMDRVGAIIDAVVEAGGDAVRVEYIEFTVEDPSSYYDDVRREAMADAQARAGQLAELGGVRLGKPTFISEGGISVPGSAVAVAKEATGADAPETPISAGEIDISLTVQVVYAIR